MALNVTMQDISGDGSVMLATWNALDATNNVGNAISFAQWADRSVQMFGTFNAATVVWEGSNDNGNSYTTLTNPQGTGISHNSAAMDAVTEVCQMARPRSSGGGIAQSVVVAAVLRRANPMRT